MQFLKEKDQFHTTVILSSHNLSLLLRSRRLDDSLIFSQPHHIQNTNFIFSRNQDKEYLTYIRAIKLNETPSSKLCVTGLKTSSDYDYDLFDYFTNLKH